MAMPLFFGRVLIILVIGFVLILLRRYLKRVIFILVLVIITSFLYSIFSPSAGNRLFTTVKNIPNHIAYFFGGEEVKEQITQSGEKAQSFLSIYQYMDQGIKAQELIGIDAEIAAQLQQIDEILKSEDYEEDVGGQTNFSEVTTSEGQDMLSDEEIKRTEIVFGFILS